MPDTASPPPRKSALAAVCRPGDFGRVPAQGPGVEVVERRGLAIAQIAAWPDTTAAVADVIAKAMGIAPPAVPARGVSKDVVDILDAGPHRWWVVTPDDADPTALLAAALGDHAAVTAQGHGRTALRLAGPRVRDLLAKGSTIDFHPSVFAAGTCVQTVLAHLSATLYCRDDGSTVDLYVLRSFGEHLYEWLMEAAAEYGCRVIDPGAN